MQTSVLDGTSSMMTILIIGRWSLATDVRVETAAGWQPT
jgi:hypothetical protein